MQGHITRKKLLSTKSLLLDSQAAVRQLHIAGHELSLLNEELKKQLKIREDNMFNLAMLAARQQFHPDAMRHFVRMSDISNYTLLHQINTLIIALHNTGVWDKLDDLCVIHNNAADSLLGLKGNVDATMPGAVTPFSLADGFSILTAPEAWIDTHLSNTGISLYADFNHSQFAYATAVPATPGTIHLISAGDYAEDPAGTRAEASVWLSGNPGNNYSSAFTTCNVSSYVNSRELGFHCGSRISNTQAFFRANNLTATDLTDITAIAQRFAPEVSLSIGRKHIRQAVDSYEGINADGFKCAGWGAGSGLTAQEMLDLRNAVETYMVARGVSPL